MAFTWNGPAIFLSGPDLTSSAVAKDTDRARARPRVSRTRMMHSFCEAGGNHSRRGGKADEIVRRHRRKTRPERSSYRRAVGHEDNAVQTIRRPRRMVYSKPQMPGRSL